MSKTYSPKIVTDGLVMYLDPSQNKSYGTTDLPVKGGLLLWLDASDDSTFSYSSGTEVSQWRDKSGNNFHANQSTTAVQPTRNTNNNSRKSVNFVAANADYMVISSGIALPNDASIFIVYKPATQSYQYAVLIDNYHGQGGNYGFVIQRVSFNSEFYYGNAGDGAGFIDTSASPWTYTDNVIQLLSLNKASSTGTPYISGTAQTSRSIRAATAQYTTGLAIGYWGNGGGRFYNGDMCEILIFNRSLSSAEMKQVHTYLGQKWGISNTDRSIIDLSGFDDNGLLGSGTVANMPAYDYYEKGSFRFDGSDDYIDLGTNSSLTSLTNSITVEAWIKIPVSTNRYTIYGNGYSGTGMMFGTSANTPGGLEVYYPTIFVAYSTAGVLQSNVWQHVVYTRSGSGLNTHSFYINGVSQAVTQTANGGDSWGTSGTNRYLGLRGGVMFNGQMSTVKVYNRALNATEVAQNYEAQKSRFANTIVQQGLVLNLDAGNPYSYAGSGTTWYDASGTGNNGTLTNGPVYNSINGGVITLDGIDDYITCANSASLQITSALTLETWFYNTAAVDGLGMIVKGPLSSDYDYMLYLSGNSTTAYFYKKDSLGTSYYGGITLSLLNRWLHIVATHTSGGLYTMYVNGVAVDSATFASSSIRSTSNPLFIGAGWNPDYFYGNIGQTRIYNIALSAAQVLQNYNATKGRYGL